MSAELELDVFGVPLGIEVFDAQVATRLDWLLADIATVGRAAQRRLRLLGTGEDLILFDGEAVVRSGMGRDEAVAMLLWQLNHIAISAGSLAVLHAGCVAWKGRGLVLGGESGAGKSTLVAALVQRGFSYLSDELTGYSPADGLLWPHPVPLGLRPGSRALLPALGADRFDGERRAVRPLELCGSISGPVAPRLVVFVGHRPGADPVLEPLARTAVLGELANHALNLVDRPRHIFPALGRLADSAPGFRLVAGDLDRTCAALEALLTDGETG